MKTLAQAKAEDQAIRRYLRSLEPRSQPDLLAALCASGLFGFPRIVDSGRPNPSVLAEYLRYRAPDNDEPRSEIWDLILLIADWLDPNVKDKPWGWQLVFERGPHQRKTSYRPVDPESFEIAAKVRMSQTVARVASLKKSRKQIIGEMAQDLGVSDSRIRQHLAAAAKAEKLIHKALNQRRRQRMITK